MTYKGKTIEKPTTKMVQEFIDECRMQISAEDVIEYWSNRNFLTKKGVEVKTLEAMVNVVNSLYVRKFGTSNHFKNERWIDKNFDKFCKCMKILRFTNPDKWKSLTDKFLTNNHG